MSDKYTYLVGRVGTEPLFKTTSAGDLAEFRLAVDGDYDAATKSRPTTWYDVTVWEPMHLTTAQLGVGSRAWVAGQVSVFKGTSGDRLKIKARELGLAEKFTPTVAPAPKTIAPVSAPAGVTLDDDWD